ncbi:DUF952 domain-containing protein [Sphingobium sp. SCG-1]|uniref:DUF952 domain-containing protein n=1 Tax=Sphingobium sp. SCG-1 TaxID=2072936 RepID=UPI000CD6BAE2|nr:DUF952 domain-containing protein [Sphingobium sp. SCG-1]AUW59118.1 DUF952 domain-containing protein [Sphingobium sp. SCG-1]
MPDMFAYKILTTDEFAQLRNDGHFAGSPADLEDGYIHLSTQEQAAETAAKHFAGQDHLVLAMIDLVPLGELVKWEESRGGQQFPHLYGSLPLGAVTKHVVLRTDAEGKHQFPAGF